MTRETKNANPWKKLTSPVFAIRPGPGAGLERVPWLRTGRPGIGTQVGGWQCSGAGAPMAVALLAVTRACADVRLSLGAT